VAKKTVLPSFLAGIRHYAQHHPLRALAFASGACAAVLVVAVAVCAIALAGLGTELRDRNLKIGALTQNLSELTDDYNLLRQSLGLEPRAFAPLDAKAGAADGGPSPLESGLAVIQSRFADEAKAVRFEEFKTGALMSMLPAETGCAPVDAGLFAMNWVKKNNIYYSLAFKPDGPTVTLTAAGLHEQYTGADRDAAAAFVRKTLKLIDAYYERVASMRKTLLSLGADGEVVAVLQAKGLTWRAAGEDAVRFSAVVTRAKEDLLTITFDKREGVFLIGEKKIDPPENLAGEFRKALAGLDARTAPEKRLDAVKRSLEESFRDPAFVKACRETSLEVAPAPRESEDFLYYDVRQKGDKIGAFGINKDTAEVYFLDKDDVVISSLQTVAGKSPVRHGPGAAAGPLSLAPAGAVNTFLLLGRNGENTDTIILVRTDERAKAITLVSLPRDLYYNGSKINRYHLKGIDYCIGEISEITGIPVKKFALVDLYSLISLIDVLGGVDIDLPFDVVDPTYRIKENGVWQTLAYPRGHYHLNGVQAMRLIRSRGSTSDFQRSHRQQIIIAALFDRLKARCAGSLETSISVFSTLAGYVTTNVPPLEIASNFIAFKDYTIAGSYVLDTTNILRAVWTAIDTLSEEEQRAILDKHDESLLGAYVLLPRNGDWSLLRSYIRVLLAGGN
jgi:LCP family protein required for cell wall assembly